MRYIICNYRPTILSTYDLLDDNIICIWHLYSELYNIYRSVGHAITGNVGIATKKKFRYLLKKGYNYIESTFKNKYGVIEVKCKRHIGSKHLDGTTGSLNYIV